MNNTFPETRAHFIGQWGALGSQWGISRTMAMIHALLMVAPEELDTDQIMAELQISRGNANTNLRELMDWGLVEKVIRPGERREFFRAEKDVWRMFCIIARERQRREIDPARKLLAKCVQDSGTNSTANERAFHQQVSALHDFVEMAGQVMGRIASAEKNKIIPRVLKIF